MLVQLFFLVFPLNLVYATTYKPNRYLVMNGQPNGAFAYMYSNGSLLELTSSGTVQNPAGYAFWKVNRNATEMASLGIVNVVPSTNLAGFGYLSPFTGALVQRLFYQTTNGNLVTAVHTGLPGAPGWSVDTTPVATNLPLGTIVSAFWTGIVAGGAEILMVHYGNANGVINLR